MSVRDMSFWSLHVPPGGRPCVYEVEQTPEEAQFVHVTNVAIPYRGADGAHTLTLTVGEQETTVATLDKTTPQHKLDFLLDQTVVFTNYGPGPLHLLGYVTACGMDDVDGEGPGGSSDDEDEEEDEDYKAGASSDDDEDEDEDEAVPKGVPLAKAKDLKAVAAAKAPNGHGAKAASASKALKAAPKPDKPQPATHTAEDDEDEEGDEDDEEEEDEEDEGGIPGLHSDDVVMGYDEGDEGDEDEEEDEDEDEQDEDEDEEDAPPPKTVPLGSKRPVAPNGTTPQPEKKAKGPDGATKAPAAVTPAAKPTATAKPAAPGRASAKQTTPTPKTTPAAPKAAAATPKTQPGTPGQLKPTNEKEYEAAVLQVVTSAPGKTIALSVLGGRVARPPTVQKLGGWIRKNKLFKVDANDNVTLA